MGVTYSHQVNTHFRNSCIILNAKNNTSSLIIDVRINVVWMLIRCRFYAILYKKIQIFAVIQNLECWKRTEVALTSLVTNHKTLWVIQCMCLFYIYLDSKLVAKYWFSYQIYQLFWYTWYMTFFHHNWQLILELNEFLLISSSIHELLYFTIDLQK